VEHSLVPVFLIVDHVSVLPQLPTVCEGSSRANLLGGRTLTDNFKRGFDSLHPLVALYE
jgi:hypothetical protein